MSAASSLNVAIRMLDSAAYKCGEMDGRDNPSLSLQQKYAAAAHAALENALNAGEAAQNEAYSEGRKDETAEAAKRLQVALDALDEIALAGMSGTGQESEEGMRDWHARQAWKFISIAARAKTAIQAMQA